MGGGKDNKETIVTAFCSIKVKIILFEDLQLFNIQLFILIKFKYVTRYTLHRL